MTESFEMELSLEHIHPDLIDVPVIVHVQTYRGSTEGKNSFDPSEFSVESVILKYDQPHWKPIEITEQIHKYIEEYYERR